MPRANALAAAHPEMLTSATWTRLDQRFNASTDLPVGVPPHGEWFSPPIPSGTAYDASHRMFGVRRVLLARPEELARVRALAPYETSVLLAISKVKFGAKPPLTYLRQEAGEMAAYDRTILYTMATAAAGDLDAYRPIASRLCAVDVDDCYTLAAYLADHGLDDEAAPVYEHYVDAARDRVGVANRADWLIRYYEHHGDPARAMALADVAAEAYSYVGLGIKAKLLERLKKFDEADQYFSAAAVRYSRNHDLAAFYLRRASATGLQKYRDLAGPLVKKTFKDGMLPIPSDAPDAAPQFGVRVIRAAARGAAAGVRDEDIIVSVDDIRVQTLEQYQIARQIEDVDPQMSLVLWRDGRLVSVRGVLRHAWGSALLASYDWRQPIL